MLSPSALSSSAKLFYFGGEVGAAPRNGSRRSRIEGEGSSPRPIYEREALHGRYRCFPSTTSTSESSVR